MERKEEGGERDGEEGSKLSIRRHRRVSRPLLPHGTDVPLRSGRRDRRAGSIILVLPLGRSSRRSRTDHQDPLPPRFIPQPPILLHRTVHDQAMPRLAAFSTPNHHPLGVQSPTPRSLPRPNRRTQHPRVQREEFRDGDVMSYTSDFLPLPVPRPALGALKRHTAPAHARVVFDPQRAVRVAFGVVDPAEGLVAVRAQVRAGLFRRWVRVLHDQGVR